MSAFRAGISHLNLVVNVDDEASLSSIWQKIERLECLQQQVETTVICDTVDLYLAKLYEQLPGTKSLAKAKLEEVVQRQPLHVNGHAELCCLLTRSEAAASSSSEWEVSRAKAEQALVLFWHYDGMSPSSSQFKSMESLFEESVSELCLLAESVCGEERVWRRFEAMLYEFHRQEALLFAGSGVGGFCALAESTTVTRHCPEDESSLRILERLVSVSLYFLEFVFGETTPHPCVDDVLLRHYAARCVFYIGIIEGMLWKSLGQQTSAALHPLRLFLGVVDDNRLVEVAAELNCRDTLIAVGLASVLIDSNKEKQAHLRKDVIRKALAVLTRSLDLHSPYHVLHPQGRVARMRVIMELAKQGELQHRGMFERDMAEAMLWHQSLTYSYVFVLYGRLLVYEASYGSREARPRLLRDGLLFFDRAIDLPTGMQSEACSHRANCLQKMGRELAAVESFKMSIEAASHSAKNDISWSVKALAVLMLAQRCERDELRFWLVFSATLFVESSLQDTLHETRARLGDEGDALFHDVVAFVIERRMLAVGRLLARVLPHSLQDTLRVWAEQQDDLDSQSDDDSDDDVCEADLRALFEDDVAELELTALFVPPRRGQAAPSRPLSPRCHFFVIHSLRDTPWVQFMLLPRLERGHQLQGCLAVRDFEAGKTVADNMLAAIERSHKVVIVLTSHLVNRLWPLLHAHERVRDALLHSIHRTIPLLVTDEDSECAASGPFPEVLLRMGTPVRKLAPGHLNWLKERILHDDL